MELGGSRLRWDLEVVGLELDFEVVGSDGTWR